MVQGANGLRRTRSAKIKAKKALRAQGAESDTDVDMDVDEPTTNGDLTEGMYFNLMVPGRELIDRTATRLDDQDKVSERSTDTTAYSP
jgi:hypothetical protein